MERENILNSSSRFENLAEDDSNVSGVPVKNRAKGFHTILKKGDVKVIEVAVDDDWLPPPPKNFR
ncbi:hypothetical protein Bca52824_026971 [Brassica carinata]|uniref:Uncharacterized protein n=1 Tax=Brassica carinata TaxID=52824 RepID=A0A8X7SHJ0_BRACI|nr:hypothetical protein Bca52824_026971 [Brassica carinata]